MILGSSLLLPVKKIGVPTAAATVALFTVTGGLVQIIGLFGRCTTGVGAGAVTMAFNANPSAPGMTDSPLSIASASLALKPVGTLISITGAVVAAPTISVGEGAIAGMTTPLLVGPGVIEVIFAVGDAAGVFDFYCNWSPVDPMTALT